MNDVEAGQTHSGFLPLVSAMFLMSFSSFMLMGALPKSLLDNGAGALAIGVVMGGFGVSAALSRLFLGPAIDRLPYRLSLGLPALTLGATWLAAAFLPVGTALLVPRALQGAAVGYFNAAAFAWIAKNIAASARGRHMGIAFASSGLSLVSAPPVGLWLYFHLKIQDVFFVAAGFALIALLLAPAGRPQRTPASQGAMAGAARQWVWWGLVSGGLMMTLGAFEAFLPMLAASRSVAQLPLLYAAFAVGLVTGRLSGGILADRLGRRQIIWIAIAAILFSLLAWNFLFGSALAALTSLVYGAGIGGANVGIQAIVSDSAASGQQGRAMSLSMMFNDLGTSLGASLAGAVLIRTAPVGVTWATALIVIAIAVMLFSAREFRRPQSVKTENA